MIFANNDAAGQPQRTDDALVQGGTAMESHSYVTESDAVDAADRVADHWVNAAKSLVQACALLVRGLNFFAKDPEKLDVFLARLVAKRVFSENDVLARLKANGKLAMLGKIGRNAETLLQPSVLCLLPAHYSIIYQICLLVEEVGCERAKAELAAYSDIAREDVLKMRAALKAPDTTPEPVAPVTVDGFAAQLFAVRFTTQSVRSFASDYASIDTLDQCLRRPQPADNAGLVAIVPILALGTFEREFMPLLGFDGPDHLFFGTAPNQPEITDLDVIVVAKRGGFRPELLTAFPSDAGSVLKLAEFFFPGCDVKCQLFADARASGWSTLIGDENWIEKPSVR
ncbi:hypothetical protein CQ12_32300 [Bradyrhizobium jicamae]|uniref:Uncharacterized protein n=1 Tax=Bradyrhizobium jicamae TaxID=280332 RepID=A0A0R3M4P7_9BRAD|nr:hypothetical protein [Bradyrhizobium jicamae]KRR14924.1 hypothetical protein CQ12_32300 [Bradyrhizobium jicamae]